MNKKTNHPLDKKTCDALKELEQIQKTLQACEEQLFRICREQTHIYLSVPFSTQKNFQSIAFSIDDMKRILQGNPSLREG